MRSSFHLRILLLTLLLPALAGLVSATGTVQVFVHPGGGTVCVAGQCQSNVGTVYGTGSAQFQVTCGMDHSVLDYYTPGYQSYKSSVYMDYNCDMVTSDIYLVPVPTETETPTSTTGDIQVYISPDPESGMICLDNGRCQGDVAEPSHDWSVHWSGVSPNLHTISIDGMNGYESAEQQVSVTSDEISTVNINLVPDTTETETAAETPAETPTGSTPAAATTASPLGNEIVILATGAAGALMVFRNRSG